MRVSACVAVGALLPPLAAHKSPNARAVGGSLPSLAAHKSPNARVLHSKDEAQACNSTLGLGEFPSRYGMHTNALGLEATPRQWKLRGIKHLAIDEQRVGSHWFCWIDGHRA